MDRSFLSDTGVIAAARNFVCIRLMTYESADEAKVLTSVFTGRSGDLENSTFALLAQDGKRKLTRSGRSPDMIFRGSEEETATDEMARRLRELADEHGFVDGKPTSKKAKSAAHAALPAIADVRLALNVASCDQTPLVIVRGKTAKDVAAAEKRLVPLAWSDDFRGRFAFATTSDAEELEPVADPPEAAAFLVVAPDVFGVKGTVLAHASAAATDDELAAALKKGIEAFRPQAKDAPTQIRDAREEGVRWESEIPVTDPGPPGGRRRPR